MLLIKLIFVVTFAVYNSVQDCDQVTFKNIKIQIKFNDRRKTDQITGCITPQSLTNYIYNKTEYIQIDGQNIPQLNAEAIANFTDNFYVSFQNNNLKIIKSGAFINLPGLRRITITSNDLNTIEVGAFMDLPSLEGLFLSKNKIKSLEPNTFQNLPKFLTLELQNNQLEYFEKEWFKNTPVLEYIDLSHNKIISIPRAAFANLPNLQWLELHSNKIFQIHGNAFEVLENLILLDLSHNNIEMFNVDLSPLKNIEELLINNNKLTYIPETVLKNLASSARIFLIFPNPLQCLCYDKVLKWGFENNIRLSNYSSACVNKNNPVCISLAEETKCLENIDHDTNESLNKIFYASFNENCED